jgi:hypothetical protein
MFKYGEKMLHPLNVSPANEGLSREVAATLHMGAKIFQKSGSFPLRRLMDMHAVGPLLYGC